MHQTRREFLKSTAAVAVAAAAPGLPAVAAGAQLPAPAVAQASETAFAYEVSYGFIPRTGGVWFEKRWLNAEGEELERAEQYVCSLEDYQALLQDDGNG